MKPLTIVLACLLAIAAGAQVAVRKLDLRVPLLGTERVVVAHWATGHLTRDGLLKDMAAAFNHARHETTSGARIVVEVYDAPSELQARYLSERLRLGTRLDLHAETNGYVEKDIPEPTIVTPSSAHWLVSVNHEVGRRVVDLDTAEIIVRPVIGIVTYEEMARCLGWPEKSIGFADIIGLRADPLGWARYPCARAEWGRRPLLAFTDPRTSSTGRSLFLALYAFAAGKAPEDLTLEDIEDPDVVVYVRGFQGLIDHYLIGTTVLNTKIYQGPRYGHFFVMPEDNLIHLYEGTEKSYLNGVKTVAPPIEKRMVMIYPKEGSLPRRACACIVRADWVNDAQRDAARHWIEYIREDPQQRRFVAAGFRPGTELALNYPGSKFGNAYGLDPDGPRSVVNPSLTPPEVAAAIDASWVDVKRPGIVTFVVDTSDSMSGGKLDEAKRGLVRAVDAMSGNNQVGLVSFASSVHERVAIGPLGSNKFALADAADGLRAQGGTALFDAVKAAIEMTDVAPGDPDAIRGVVVLTDGLSNGGDVELHDLIRITSHPEERPIRSISTWGGGTLATVDGRRVEKKNLVGTGLVEATEHHIQVFYIAVGDADLEVGRLLAGATGAEFQGAGEADLANVLEEFSKYF